MQRAWPVSVKGVVLIDDSVILALNDRGEWELPGGRLEDDETPEQCVERGIEEETGRAVVIGPVIGSWVFEVVPGHHVLVVAYGGQLASPGADLQVSDEHLAVEFVPVDKLNELALPDGYRAAIAEWRRR